MERLCLLSTCWAALMRLKPNSSRSTFCRVRSARRVPERAPVRRHHGIAIGLGADVQIGTLLDDMPGNVIDKVNDHRRRRAVQGYIPHPQRILVEYRNLAGRIAFSLNHRTSWTLTRSGRIVLRQWNCVAMAVVLQLFFHVLNDRSAHERMRQARLKRLPLALVQAPVLGVLLERCAAELKIIVQVHAADRLAAEPLVHMSFCRRRTAKTGFSITSLF